MKYLLDTCTVSDFVKGEKNTLARLKEISPSDIAISTITLMEIQFGLALNTKYADLIKPVITDFLKTIDILDFTQAQAAQAALLRAVLKQQGCPIGSYDILLAGVALSHNLIFVTSNVKEFNRINGLSIENWRTSP